LQHQLRAEQGVLAGQEVVHAADAADARIPHHARQQRQFAQPAKSKAREAVPKNVLIMIQVQTITFEPA
jgi:hypothetical protein